MKPTSVLQTAIRWGVSTKLVAQLYRENRVEGATKLSGVWIIPDTALKPFDGREQLPATTFSDCETYNEDLLVDRSRPTMTLKQYKFCFNAGFLKRFPYTERIEILCCEAASELLILPSKVDKAASYEESNGGAGSTIKSDVFTWLNDSSADSTSESDTFTWLNDSSADSTSESTTSFTWCYIRNGKKIARIIQNRAVAVRIYAMTDCLPNKSYRFLAYHVMSDPESVLRINLKWHVGMKGFNFAIQHIQEPPFNVFTPIV